MSTPQQQPGRKLGDIRKPRAPANTPPSGGSSSSSLQLGGQGVLPLIPGTVSMTEFEKNELKKLGWKEGDPIPKDFANTYAAVKAAQAAADEMPQIDVSAVTPLVVPEAKDIKELPKWKQKELVDALAAAKVQAEMFKRQEKTYIKDAGPGVNEAIQAGLETPMSGRNDLIDDDLSDRSAKTPPKTAPTFDAPLQSSGPVSDLPPDDSDLDAKSGAGGAERLKNCPHCGWDLSRQEDIEVTDEDKLRWLIAQEGQQRFKKDYHILGGRMTVTFRSLSAKESDVAFRQVAVDGGAHVRMRAPDTEDGYWRNLMTYRLAMGIERLWSATLGPIHNPTLDEWQVDKEDYPYPNTKVYAILGPVTEAMFPTENLRRQIGAAFHRFQLLVEKLEANADNDPFWRGIGQPS